MIFRENNVTLRYQFFADPLTKYLWSIFINESPEICISHLRRIRSMKEQGEAKFERLLKDIQLLELNFNFKMIPDFARNKEDIRVFTQQEEYSDLIENGKYNKKQANSVRENIKHMQKRLKQYWTNQLEAGSISWLRFSHFWHNLSSFDGDKFKIMIMILMNNKFNHWADSFIHDSIKYKFELLMTLYFSFK